MLQVVDVLAIVTAAQMLIDPSVDNLKVALLFLNMLVLVSIVT